MAALVLTFRLAVMGNALILVDGDACEVRQTLAEVFLVGVQGLLVASLAFCLVADLVARVGEEGTDDDDEVLDEDDEHDDRNDESESHEERDGERPGRNMLQVRIARANDNERTCPNGWAARLLLLEARPSVDTSQPPRNSRHALDHVLRFEFLGRWPERSACSKPSLGVECSETARAALHQRRAELLQ